GAWERRPSGSTARGQAWPRAELRDQRSGSPAQISAAAMEQEDRDRDAFSSDSHLAEGPGAQLLVDATLGQERQAEARLDHSLLSREAVDRDDLGRTQPPRGESVRKRPRIRLVERLVARRERDPPLGAERPPLQAPAPSHRVARAAPRHPWP